MRLHRHLPFIGLTPIVVASAFMLGAQGAKAQTFAVSAAAVNSGVGGASTSVNYTVSHVPEAGLLVMGCAYSGSPSFQEQAKLPVCGIGPPVAISVTAGQTVTGTLGLKPWGAPEPAAQGARQPSTAPVSGLVMAAGLVLGFWIKRKDARLLFMLLVAAAGLVLAASATGCGGNSYAGIYPYTVTATLTPSPAMPLEVQTSTTVNVTVE